MKGSRNLYGFRMVNKSREVAVKEYGFLTTSAGEIHFVGDVTAAQDMAAQFQAQMANKFPAQDVKVTAVVRERLGPHAVAHLARVGTEREEWKVIARFLAWQMAQAAARGSLELNPDLPAIASRIIEEARAAAFEKVEQARAQKTGALVDAHGQPLGSSRG